MASPLFFPTLVLLFLLSHLISTPVAEIIFEDGYSVSTVLDGDKSSIKVNPQAILHQSPPSDLFILLDSVASTIYTVSLTTNSNNNVIQRLAGNGEHNYVDGDLGSARFYKPRSFAVDYKGNIYIAEQRNHAIRKISKSGVTTIAGGYPQKAGHNDGPGRNASFSDDFELTFVPERCALMVSDHGNRLVRQINLKAEDCKKHSGSVLGTTSVWLLGLGLSCLLGLIVGFVIRPYIIPYEGYKPLRSSWTWTHCLMSLERQIVMLCSDSRSAIVKSPVYLLLQQIIMLSLSHLSFLFRHMMVESRLESRTMHEKSVSLLDLDEVSSSSRSSSSSNTAISSKVDDQLNDMLTFGGGLMVPVNANEAVKQENKRESTDVYSDDNKNIDGMILANLVNFEEQAPRVGSPVSLECSLGLVKRK